MDLTDAIDFIRPGVKKDVSTWADIGAGSGLFTMAICNLIPDVQVYAVDKNPHMLWSLEPSGGSKISVVEGDFKHSLDLPEVNGMIMANALHYASDPIDVLNNVIDHLLPGGIFLLIEYESFQPNQWVPFPVSFEKFQVACSSIGLQEPVLVNTRPTMYGHQHMYLAMTYKI
jgi:ubiquinone/menaquinone biosynthesis C-methylase UbiE